MRVRVRVRGRGRVRGSRGRGGRGGAVRVSEAPRLAPLRELAAGRAHEEGHVECHLVRVRVRVRVEP